MKNYSKADFNLTWKQVKSKYPKLKPYSDADYDGTLNIKDCKPLDPNRDGLFGRALGVISGGRMGQTKEQYRAEKVQKNVFGTIPTTRKRWETRFDKTEKVMQRIPTRLKQTAKKVYRQIPGRKFGEKFTKQMERPSIAGAPVTIRKRNVYTTGGGIVYRPQSLKRGGKGAGVGKRTGRVGRPTGSYTYRHPVTGQPIHVWQYRKVVNALKRQNKALAERRDQIEQMRLARQGIPPQQAQIIVNSRQIRQAIAQPQEAQVQEAPIQVPQQAQPNTLQQAEFQRIQTQVLPWERRAAMNRLMRQQRVQQMEQQQQGLQEQRMEVSLLDGKTYPKDVSNIQRRERWTYS